MYTRKISIGINFKRITSIVRTWFLIFRIQIVCTIFLVLSERDGLDKPPTARKINLHFLKMRIKII